MKHKIFKKIYTQLIVALSVVSLSLNSSTQAAIFITPKAPSINAVSYLLLDYQSGVVIASKKPNEKRAPASLTKLMTAYIVFQLLKDGRISLEDDVKISKKAWKTGGSKSFVEVGKNIKLKTLLKGMLIQSGNDSSVALAEHIAGTEGTFATYMNRYAKQIGMLHSNFENASGLPNKNQYTTAMDMSILASATIRDFPKFYAWYSQKEFTHNGITQRNRNRLLWSDHTVDGLKTGYTKRAGYNIVVSAKRMNMRLISVVLGSTSSQARFSQAQTILDYGFRFFETTKIDKIDKKIPISNSTKATIKIGFNAPQVITLPRGQYKLTQQMIELNKDLTTPFNKGDQIGHLILKFKEEVLLKLPVIAFEDAPQSNFFFRILEKIGF